MLQLHLSDQQFHCLSKCVLLETWRYHKPSHCKILQKSQICDICNSNHLVAFESERQLTRIIAEAPVKFQTDMLILFTNFVASWDLMRILIGYWNMPLFFIMIDYVCLVRWSLWRPIINWQASMIILAGLLATPYVLNREIRGGGYSTNFIIVPIFRTVKTLGPVLLLRHDAAARILANGSAAFIESCAAIGWNSCDSDRSL